MDGSCSDDSEIEEERAGGGPGPTGGGPEQEDSDRGRICRAGPGLTTRTSIRNAGGAFTNRTRMTAEPGDTRRASGHCMCVLHMHTQAGMGSHGYDHLMIPNLNFKFGLGSGIDSF
jgi:hypothetical protein